MSAFHDRIDELETEFEKQFLICGNCRREIVSVYDDGSGWAYYDLYKEQMFCEECYDEEMEPPKIIPTKSVCDRDLE